MTEKMPENIAETGEKVSIRDLVELGASKRKEIVAGVQAVSDEINESLKLKLLAGTGSVSRKNYGFSKEVLKEHDEYIDMKEDKYIRDTYNLQSNTPITKEMKMRWEREQEDRLSELMEMVVMIILYKFLKEEYIPCRAAKYDDYHGVDNILVHKKSGAVLCAFDDVREVGANAEKSKLDYVKEKASSGGQKITYGFTTENEEIVKKTIFGVPKLYLGFTNEWLAKAIKAVNTKDLNSVSQEELEVYSHIIELLTEQTPMLKELGGHHKPLMKNIETFEGLIPNLESYKYSEQYNQAA